MITLRPYQEEAVASVYEHLRTRDDNPCVVIPTGGGKTPVMATICRDAVKNWQGRVLILAHVKELLEQSAEKLQQLCPEIKFGIYSAGLKRRDTKAPVIVAGIQSIYKRACDLGPFDLILVDEAHMIAVEGEGMYRQSLADARIVCPHLRIVGFTATPFRLKSGLICTPDHFLNHVCYEVGVRQLIVQGYLSPLHSLMTKPLSKEVSMQTAVQHPNIPTRFVLGSDGRHDVLCCPVCACPYVHPAEVAVEQGRTRTVVTEEATDVLATDRFLRARGSLITLDFWCEFGHAFQYSLEFHKGHMHLKLATEPLDVSQPLDQLWRD